jgi:hypothetical protein
MKSFQIYYLLTLVLLFVGCTSYVLTCKESLPTNIDNNVGQWQSGIGVYTGSPLILSTKYLLVVYPNKTNYGITITPEIGLCGGKIGIGIYRASEGPFVHFNLLSISGRIAYLHTWGKQAYFPGNTGWIGIEGQFNFLFAALNSGVYINKLSRPDWVFPMNLGIEIKLKSRNN